ncbi:MAG TPA: T9SS type A sorting domain-containing protein, partial [Parafilimonas sp.]|nr:T9SS type A sorting domain-containing protein [Parafilimonas sp.]
WQKSLGGSLSDEAFSIDQTTDGGYIVAGISESNDSDVSGNHGLDDYWLVKLKKNGVIQWQKSLGGSTYDDPTSIQQTSDSGYIVAGHTDSNDGDVSGNHGIGDYWIVKLDKYGGILWQKCLGGGGLDGANAIQQTADGGYVVAGYSGSNNNQVSGNNGGFDYWVVKLKKNGFIQWQESLGGSALDVATSVQQTTDSGYIVAGYSTSRDSDVSGNKGSFDFWVVKLAKDGLSPVVSQTTNLYAERQSKNETNTSKDFTVYPNPARDILHIGTSINAVFSFLNSSGEILFTKTINDNAVINISQLPPGNYYVRNNTTGTTEKLIVER